MGTLEASCKCHPSVSNWADFFLAHLENNPVQFLCSVHDDVQLCQWLRTRDGKLKLGDFNRAEVMDFDRGLGEYCMYNNGKGYGNVSPEFSVGWAEIE